MENHENGSNTQMSQDEIEAIVRLYLEKTMMNTAGKTAEELRTIERIIEKTTF